MQFAKHRNDQDIKWMAGDKHFKKIDEESAELIKTVTGVNIRFDEKAEVVNMWAAWENGINQARSEGFNNGFNNGLADGEAKGRDTTIVKIIRNLMKTFGWNAKQTMDAMKIPTNEQEKYAKQI